MSRDRAWLALILLFAIGIFLVDVLLLPGIIVPGAPYFVPIVLAAYLLRPRWAATVAGFTLILRMLSDMDKQIPIWEMLLFLVAVLIVSYLSIALSARMVHEAALAQEIDERRRLFETVVENAPIGIAVLSGATFVIELINPAYQAIAPGKAMLGRTVAEVWPELADQVLPLLRQVRETGEPFSATDRQLPVQRVSGGPLEDLYFTFSYVPLGNVGGQADSILVLVIETTEQVRVRKRIEELASVAQRRAAELQGVMDSIVDAVFACDANGRLTMVNKAVLNLLGVTSLPEFERPAMELAKLFRLRHEDGSSVALEELPLARALKGEIVILEDFIAYNPRTQTDAFIRTSAAPIRDEQGTIVGAVSVARDVTALAELDRLKDQFIAVAAHELKTPVTVMKGYAQALLRAPEAVPEPRRKMLEGINRGADRIDRVVKDLLDISRLHLGHLELSAESIDLPALVENLVTRMETVTARHRIQVARAEPVVVQGDRDRLEQVMVNLLDNAIKYSPAGGDIDVVVEVLDHEAVVSVTDHGVGIPREKQSHIFERFYSAHTGTPYDYGGMGVGLFISSEIVKGHGGRMWFESEEGKGSTFHLSLPLGVAHGAR